MPAPSSPAPQPKPDKRRCTIYIDAFNWYYGIFVHHPEWKWLNIEKFFAALRLDEQVTWIGFFTAIVDPKKQQSLKRDRQRRYLKALKAQPCVEVILGKYQNRTVTCQANACPRHLTYEVGEEKKTDVNIAVRLIDDAVHGRTDSMVIVSADSDLEPAVQWVRKNHPAISITVYIPALPDELSSRRNDNYQNMGVTCRLLPLGDIHRYVLLNTVALPDGTTVTKP
jgi:hypothetical protein